MRAQEGVQLELVLVDDGSTDGSVEIAMHCWSQAPWPLQVLSSPFRGVSAARNLGWQAARYPLVAFLDADDLMLPGRLARQAQQFLRDPHLQQSLCGWRRIGPNGEVGADLRPWQEGAGFDLQQALRHKAVLPSAWMLRREVFQHVGGFDPSLTQAEDVDLLLRCAAAGLPGQWLEEVLCGYRVHPDGASRRVRAQARGLSYVVERHLLGQANRVEVASLAAEVRYGTRAWLGWYAWHAGDRSLASELWTTTLGLSPLPPALTWVHLAENVVRSTQRIGVPADLGPLLASPEWRALEGLWWSQQRAARPSRNLCVEPCRQPWPAMVRGSVENALLGWGLAFRADLAASTQVDWHPQAMRQWALGEPGLNELRIAVLEWCEDLLEIAEQASAPEFSPADKLASITSLRQALAVVLQRWAALVWPHDRRPALQRLEQAAMVWPTPESLQALARLHRSSSPAGGEALAQLARRAPAAPSPDSHENLQLPSAPVFWEQPHHQSDQCHGPQCSSCIDGWLREWAQSEHPNGVIEWRPPKHLEDDISGIHDRRIVDLPSGQAWLRSPARQGWNATHAITVADQYGEILPAWSSRYPRPLAMACTHASVPSDPPPSAQPKWFDATVVVLAGLSAETYYHWLFEVWPTLALFRGINEQKSVSYPMYWHNGGDAGYVREMLVDIAGISPEQLIDAQAVPWIHARRLLAATPPLFGWPSSQVQNWLRSQCLTPFQARKCGGLVWLWRGSNGRRPVFGEQAVLDALNNQGLVVNVLHCESLSIKEQARRIAAANCVVAPHGGAMANLVFASPGTRVLELHHPSYAPPYFHALIRERQLRWFSQSQLQSTPCIYSDLFFESPATEPIVLDVARVVAAILDLVKGS